MSHFLRAWRSASQGHLVRSISLPRIRQHRTRSSLTVLGVALGVAVVVAVGSVNRAILSSFTETVQSIAGGAQLQIRGGSMGLDEGLLAQTRNVDGVLHVTLAMEQTAHAVRNGAPDEDLLVVGIDFLNQDDLTFREPSKMGFEAIARDPLAFLNSPYHLVLGRGFARRFGYKVRDRIALRTPVGVRDFEIWGLVEERGLGRTFGGAVAVMDYAALQVAFERGRNVDQLDVRVREGQDLDEVAQRIRARLGAGFSVARPERSTARLEKLLGALRGGLGMASLVAVLVGMFLIYSTMSVSVSQRRQEIGVLRALGATRRQVVWLFTAEGGLLGLVGSTIGLGLGLLLARAMLGGMQSTVRELFVQVALRTAPADAAVLGFGLSVGVAASALTSVIPAIAASRVQPSEACRGGRHALNAPRRPQRRTDVAALLFGLCSIALLQLPPVGDAPVGAALACGTSALAGALVMPRIVQLLHRAVQRVVAPTQHVSAHLGADALVRDVGRVAAAASALMVSVAMSLAFACLVSSFTSSTLRWVDQMLPADLWITSGARLSGGGSVAMSDALYPALRALPQVAFVERVRMADVDLHGSPVKLIAVDSQVFERRAHLWMIEGSEQEALRGLRAGECVISENLSRRWNLMRGEQLELATSLGPRQLRIAAVIVEYTSDQGSILIDREAYLRDWRDSRVDSFKLFLRPGADAEAVRRHITRRFASHGLTVLTQGEFRAEIEALLERTFSTMHVLELLAIVIAVLGVINAVLASVLDRTRELGVLRAIGMLRRQVRRMIVFESALLGLAGAMGGVLLGLSIGYILLAHINVVQTGWYLPYRPSLWSTLAAALPPVAAAAISGMYPAALAARKPLPNALVYE